MSESAAPFVLRPMEKTDEPFVYNSWLKSYRDSPTVRSIPNSIYFVEHHLVIENIFADPRTKVLIVCNPEDRDQIYGYGVGGKSIDPASNAPVGVIHWIYVKHPFRDNGIGRALEAEYVKDVTGVFYTHRVKMLDRLIGEKKYIYNPYML